jgi:hypothetical protein
MPKVSEVREICFDNEVIYNVYYVPVSGSVASSVLALFCGGCAASVRSTSTGLLKENSARPTLWIIIKYC